MPHSTHTTANEVNSVIPFFRRRKWSLEQESDSSRVTELINGNLNFRLSYSQVHGLNPMLIRGFFFFHTHKEERGVKEWLSFPRSKIALLLLLLCACILNRDYRHVDTLAGWAVVFYKRAQPCVRERVRPDAERRQFRGSGLSGERPRLWPSAHVGSPQL